MTLGGCIRRHAGLLDVLSPDQFHCRIQAEAFQGRAWKLPWIATARFAPRDDVSPRGGSKRGTARAARRTARRGNGGLRRHRTVAIAICPQPIARRLSLARPSRIAAKGQNEVPGFETPANPPVPRACAFAAMRCRSAPSPRSSRKTRSRACPAGRSCVRWPRWRYPHIAGWRVIAKMPSAALAFSRTSRPRGGGRIGRRIARYDEDRRKQDERRLQQRPRGGHRPKLSARRARH